jgi:hypothetical protein
MDSANSHDEDEAAVEEMLATQDPKGSGKVDKLILSFSVLDLSLCVDMREPWMEGLRSEKVSLL